MQPPRRSATENSAIRMRDLSTRAVTYATTGQDDRLRRAFLWTNSGKPHLPVPDATRPPVKAAWRSLRPELTLMPLLIAVPLGLLGMLLRVPLRTALSLVLRRLARRLLRLG